jgi:hypothetical protein
MINKVCAWKMTGPLLGLRVYMSMRDKIEIKWEKNAQWRTSRQYSSSDVVKEMTKSTVHWYAIFRVTVQYVLLQI